MIDDSKLSKQIIQLVPHAVAKDLRSTNRFLPKLISSKIYKTGQTRGSDDDEIYQNRVSRNSTVLIPYSIFDKCKILPEDSLSYQNGFIVLISPEDYFSSEDINTILQQKSLYLGKNVLVFYETRKQWNDYNPDALGWVPANSRTDPLNGQYVARVSATTATTTGDKINRGFNITQNKGAGIRVYEYASNKTIAETKYQLEALFWSCADSQDVVVFHGMLPEQATLRKRSIIEVCNHLDLLDMDQLVSARIINQSGHTVCPLCLTELSAEGFLSRMNQAEGRIVHDLTVTQINLFHIQELRFGTLNHKPYNLGWGHHHCNVVVKDSGIIQTLHWMKDVVDRNLLDGQLPLIPASGS